MDKVLADTLRANLKSARTPDERMNALIIAMIAVVDSQLQAESKIDTMWGERSRYYWAGRVVFGLVASGGFAMLVKLMKVTGVL